MQQLPQELLLHQQGKPSRPEHAVVGHNEARRQRQRRQRQGRGGLALAGSIRSIVAREQRTRNTLSRKRSQVGVRTSNNIEPLADALWLRRGRDRYSSELWCTLLSELGGQPLRLFLLVLVLLVLGLVLGLLCFWRAVALGCKKTFGQSSQQNLTSNL